MSRKKGHKKTKVAKRGLRLVLKSRTAYRVAKDIHPKMNPQRVNDALKLDPKAIVEFEEAPTDTKYADLKVADVHYKISRSLKGK